MARSLPCSPVARSSGSSGAAAAADASGTRVRVRRARQSTVCEEAGAGGLIYVIHCYLSGAALLAAQTSEPILGSTWHSGSCRNRRAWLCMCRHRQRAACARAPGAQLLPRLPRQSPPQLQPANREAPPRRAPRALVASAGQARLLLRSPRLRERPARRGHGRGAEQRAWQAGACRACRADDPRCCGAARAPRRRARMCGRVWAAVSGVGGGAHGPRAGRAARASSGGLLEQMGRRPGRPGTGGGCRGATGGPGGAAPRARGLGGRAGSGQGERRGGRRLCARQASDQPPPALTVCAATASAARRRALPVARHACSGFRGAQCCRRRAHGRQYPLP